MPDSQEKPRSARGTTLDRIKERVLSDSDGMSAGILKQTCDIWCDFVKAFIRMSMTYIRRNSR